MLISVNIFFLSKGLSDAFHLSERMFKAKVQVLTLLDLITELFLLTAPPPPFFFFYHCQHVLSPSDGQLHIYFMLCYFCYCKILSNLWVTISIQLLLTCFRGFIPTECQSSELFFPGYLYFIVFCQTELTVYFTVHFSNLQGSMNIV